MKSLVTCPLCENPSLATIKTYQFTLEEALRNSTISANVNAVQERLWIYFYHFLDNPATAEVRVEQCHHCGFIFTNPRLSQEDLVKKYQIIGDLGRDAKRHVKDRPKFIEQRKARIKKWITPLVKDKLPEKWSVLDYGGAEGYLLAPYLEQGHQAYLCDYMPYQLADERITYLGKDIADIPSELQFDLVLCLHTLEHVADPIALVRSLATQLTKTGYLYVEVPLGAWMEWNDIREPLTHVNYFSEQSLAYVFEKAGMEVVAIQSNWQYVTHAEHLCINILGSQLPTSANEVSHEKPAPLSTDQQMSITRYLSGGLRNNFRYYLKQSVRRLTS